MYAMPCNLKGEKYIYISYILYVGYLYLVRHIAAQFKHSTVHRRFSIDFLQICIIVPSRQTNQKGLVALCFKCYSSCNFVIWPFSSELLSIRSTVISIK